MKTFFKAVWWFIDEVIIDTFSPGFSRLLSPITWPYCAIRDVLRLRRLTKEKARLEHEANERADAEIADLERLQREVSGQ